MTAPHSSRRAVNAGLPEAAVRMRALTQAPRARDERAGVTRVASQRARCAQCLRCAVCGGRASELRATCHLVPAPRLGEARRLSEQLRQALVEQYRRLEVAACAGVAQGVPAADARHRGIVEASPLRSAQETRLRTQPSASIAARRTGCRRQRRCAHRLRSGCRSSTPWLAARTRRRR